MIGYVRVGFSADYRECPPNSRLFQGAKKNGLFKLGTWGTEVHPLLAPQAGERILANPAVADIGRTVRIAP